MTAVVDSTAGPGAINRVTGNGRQWQAGRRPGGGRRCPDTGPGCRLDDADFRRRVSEVRGQLFAVAMGKLAAVAGKAADTLENLLDDADRDATRLGAAKAILEIGQRLRESVELEQRIAALERGAVEQPATTWEGSRDEP